MTHRTSELVETGIGAEWFAESPLQSQPRLDIANVFTEGVRFERVLVPVDLSTGTLSVLRRASTLAHPGSIIRVLHAVQLNIAGEDRGIARTGLIRELQR